MAITRSAPSRKALLMANCPTPNGHRITVLNRAVFRGHVSGGKNVGEKEHLLVFQSSRNLDRAQLHKWHAHVLGLSAGKAAEHVRVTVNAGRRLP